MRSLDSKTARRTALRMMVIMGALALRRSTDSQSFPTSLPAPDMSSGSADQALITFLCDNGVVLFIAMSLPDLYECISIEKALFQGVTPCHSRTRLT